MLEDRWLIILTLACLYLAGWRLDRTARGTARRLNGRGGGKR